VVSLKLFFKKTLGVFFIICLLISNLYVPKIQAKTLGDLKRELEEYKKELQENKDKQKLTEEEMTKLRNSINSISENIVKIGDEVIVLNNEINQLNEEILKLNEEILKSEEEIEALLSFVQISNGESAYLEYAFGAKDFTDFIYRIAVSEQLTVYNEQLIEQYKSNIEQNKTKTEENKKKTEELETKKTNLAKEQEKLQQELTKLSSEIERLDEYSLDIEEQIAAHTSEIKVYEERGCKDDEDIETCGLSFLPSDTQMWRPLKSGYVTSWFGRRDCSNSAVSCYHYGLDMSASNANTGQVPVYSVANGIVIKVVGLTINPNTGRYKTQCGGRRVYIKHNINGKVIVTGYLHLRSVNVKENQVVTKDTQIGIVGGYPNSNYEYYDNCSTGAHLHLEVSTGDFLGVYPTYNAYRSNPAMYINVPTSKYQTWNDRITYLK